MTPPLRIALGEYDTDWHDAARSLARAGEVVARAAAAGAGLVALPEMCTTGFTMDPAQAEPLDGPGARELGRLASRGGIAIIAGVAVRDHDGRLANMALLFDGAGRMAAAYRKQRMFTYGGEDAVYSAGTESVMATVQGVRIGLLVCYDLRFPELFRALAREVDAIVVIANWPVARRAHWDVLLRARAIENQCYVVGVNRLGEAGGLAYDGGSAAFDPWGDRADAMMGDIAAVDVDPARVAAIREEFPFLRDLAR